MHRDSAYAFACKLPLVNTLSKSADAEGRAKMDLKSVSPSDITLAKPTPPKENKSTLAMRATIGSAWSAKLRDLSQNSKQSQTGSR